MFDLRGEGALPTLKIEKPKERRFIVKTYIPKAIVTKIKVNKFVSCKTCNSSGAKNGSSQKKCHTCGGSGAVTRIQSTFLGQMQTTAVCPTCAGQGQIITDKCTSCHG